MIISNDIINVISILERIPIFTLYTDKETKILNDSFENVLEQKKKNQSFLFRAKINTCYSECSRCVWKKITERIFACYCSGQESIDENNLRFSKIKHFLSLCIIVH